MDSVLLTLCLWGAVAWWPSARGWDVGGASVVHVAVLRTRVFLCVRPPAGQAAGGSPTLLEASWPDAPTAAPARPFAGAYGTLAGSAGSAAAPDPCAALLSAVAVDVETPRSRLWVLDAGDERCPPQIFVYDLRLNKEVWRCPLPEVPRGALASLAVDGGGPHAARAYLGDSGRGGLVVACLRQRRYWFLDLAAECAPGGGSSLRAREIALSRKPAVPVAAGAAAAAGPAATTMGVAPGMGPPPQAALYITDPASDVLLALPLAPERARQPPISFGRRPEVVSAEVQCVGNKLGPSTGLAADYRAGLHYFLPRDLAAVRWDMRRPMEAEAHDVMMQDEKLLPGVAQMFVGPQRNVWALIEEPGESCDDVVRCPGSKWGYHPAPTPLTATVAPAPTSPTPLKTSLTPPMDSASKDPEATVSSSAPHHVAAPNATVSNPASPHMAAPEATVSSSAPHLVAAPEATVSSSAPHLVAAPEATVSSSAPHLVAAPEATVSNAASPHMAAPEATVSSPAPHQVAAPEATVFSPSSHQVAAPEATVSSPAPPHLAVPEATVSSPLTPHEPDPEATNSTSAPSHVAHITFGTQAPTLAKQGFFDSEDDTFFNRYGRSSTYTNYTTATPMTDSIQPTTNSAPLSTTPTASTTTEISASLSVSTTASPPRGFSEASGELPKDKVPTTPPSPTEENSVLVLGTSVNHAATTPQSILLEEQVEPNLNDSVAVTANTNNTKTTVIEQKVNKSVSQEPPVSSVKETEIPPRDVHNMTVLTFLETPSPDLTSSSLPRTTTVSTDSADGEGNEEGNAKGSSGADEDTRNVISFLHSAMEPLATPETNADHDGIPGPNHILPTDSHVGVSSSTPTSDGWLGEFTSGAGLTGFSSGDGDFNTAPSSTGMSDGEMTTEGMWKYQGVPQTEPWSPIDFRPKDEHSENFSENYSGYEQASDTGDLTGFGAKIPPSGRGTAMRNRVTVPVASSPSRYSQAGGDSRRTSPNAWPVNSGFSGTGSSEFPPRLRGAPSRNTQPREMEFEAGKSQMAAYSFSDETPWIGSSVPFWDTVRTRNAMAANSAFGSSGVFGRGQERGPVRMRMPSGESEAYGAAPMRLRQRGGWDFYGPQGRKRRAAGDGPLQLPTLPSAVTLQLPAIRPLLALQLPTVPQNLTALLSTVASQLAKTKVTPSLPSVPTPPPKPQPPPPPPVTKLGTLAKWRTRARTSGKKSPLSKDKDKNKNAPVSAWKRHVVMIQKFSYFPYL